MTAVAVESSTPVRERYYYPNFPWNQYMARTQLTRVEFVARLNLKLSTWANWHRLGVCPRAVWRRCVELWGDGDLQLVVPVATRNGYQLPGLYSAYLAEEDIQHTPVPPGGPDISNGEHIISFPVFREIMDTTLLLMRDQAAENAALRQQVRVLESSNVQLKAELALTPIESYSSTPSTTTPKVSTTERLQRLEQQLREILPGKEPGTSLMSAAAYASKQWPHLAEPVRSSVLRVLKLLHTEPRAVDLKPLYEAQARLLNATHQLRVSKPWRAFLRKREDNGWELVSIRRRGDSLLKGSER